MGKSRKSKAKHQDFQKVKLKVGKRLPKGLNETTVNFKSRSILVKNQLKAEKSDQPVTNRKLNIKDLFSQCQHYSASIKSSALSGLKELLTENPALIQGNLSVLIERVSQLFVDKDVAVRQSVLRVLTLTFGHVTQEQMGPFFPVLSAYLSSAMTHIYDDIQRDSLKFLDLLLGYFPGLVTAGCAQLLQMFIEQISHKVQKKSSRSLLVNPSSNISTMKWRQSVLKRLHTFLQALLVNVKGKESEETVSDVVKASEETETYYQPYSQSPTSKQLFQFRLSGGREKNHKASTEGVLHNRVSLHHFIQTIVPLLNDCWVEVLPSEECSSGVTSDAMGMLESILQVLQLLCRCIESQEEPESMIGWLRSTYLTDFMRHFLERFPFTQDRMAPGVSQGKKGKQSKQLQKNSQNHVSPVTLNLAICDIMTFVISDIQSDAATYPWVDKLIKYTNHVIQIGKLSHDQLAVVIDISYRVLKMSPISDSSSTLIHRLHQMFVSKVSAQKDITLLLSLLHTLLNHQQYSHVYCDVSFEKWLSSLPNMACSVDGTTQDQILSLIGQVVGRGNSVLQDSLQEEYVKLLVSADRSRGHWIEMLYFLPRINKEVLMKIADYCLPSGSSSVCYSYLLDVLRHRFEKLISGGKEDLDMSAYISFLLTLNTGVRKAAIVKERRSNHDVKDGSWLIIKTDQQKMIQHIRLSDRVTSELKLLCEEDEILQAVEQFFKSQMSQRTSLREHEVWGFLNLCLIISAARELRETPGGERGDHNPGTVHGLTHTAAQLCISLWNSRSQCQQPQHDRDMEVASTLNKQICDKLEQVLTSMPSVMLEWTEIVQCKLLVAGATITDAEVEMNCLNWILGNSRLTQTITRNKERLLKHLLPIKAKYEGERNKMLVEFIYMTDLLSAGGT